MTTATEKVRPGLAEGTDKVIEKRKALGRGLDSLLPGGPRVVAPATAAGKTAEAQSHGAGAQGGVSAEAHAQAARAAPGDAVLQLALDQIDENPYQTRRFIDEGALSDLAESIKATGVVQPIVVRPGGNGRYVLILGERRCRASKKAGKITIPAIVRRVPDQQAAEMTIVENLQRQDLNCMEQAAAFAKLSQGFGLTQEQIGDRVGLSRESVSNYMRLLKLPGTVMQYLQAGQLGFSEARILLRLEDSQAIAKLADEAVRKHYSARQLEDVVEAITLKLNQPAPDGRQGRARWQDPNIRAAQTELQRLLGVKVKISDRKGRGKIVIEYATLEDYDRVVGMLKGRTD